MPNYAEGWILIGVREYKEFTDAPDAPYTKLAIDARDPHGVVWHKKLWISRSLEADPFVDLGEYFRQSIARTVGRQNTL